MSGHTPQQLAALSQEILGIRDALLAAALFALHPIHTESVAWIAGITDLELSAFFLLTFLLYVKLGDRPAASSWQTGVLLTSYLMALLSKEQFMATMSAAMKGQTVEQAYDDIRAGIPAGRLGTP